MTDGASNCRIEEKGRSYCARRKRSPAWNSVRGRGRLTGGSQCQRGKVKMARTGLEIPGWAVGQNWCQARWFPRSFSLFSFLFFFSFFYFLISFISFTFVIQTDSN
jgi:hypothetical protein